MAKDYIYDRNIKLMINNGVLPTIEKIIESDKEHNVSINLTLEYINSIIDSYNEFNKRKEEEEKSKINIHVKAPEDINFTPTPDEMMEVCEGQPIEHYHEKDMLESLVNAKIYRHRNL